MENYLCIDVTRKRSLMIDRQLNKPQTGYQGHSVSIAGIVVHLLLYFAIVRVEGVKIINTKTSSNTISNAPGLEFREGNTWKISQGGIMNKPFNAIQKVYKHCTINSNQPGVFNRINAQNFNSMRAGVMSFINLHGHNNESRILRKNDLNKNLKDEANLYDAAFEARYLKSLFKAHSFLNPSGSYAAGTSIATCDPTTSEYNTFVSHHYRIMTEDIVEYLRRKKIEYMETPLKFTLKFCPFCPPHRFKSDNLYKHEIFKNSGNSYCHRCGYKGSLFDFKAHMGDLPGGLINDANDPSMGPFGVSQTSNEPAITMVNITHYENNLYNNEDYKCVLEYLTQTRGISINVLKKYRVGAGEFKFSRAGSGSDLEKCVVFPWLMARSFNDKAEIVVNRIKVRSIYDKSKMKILPKGGRWGMFGEHLLYDIFNDPKNGGKSSQKTVVLAEGEFDAMSIYQETGQPSLSLPNGSNSLPVALLPRLENLDHIYLWMDFDAAGQSGITHFANKLGMQRTKIVRDISEKVNPEDEQERGAKDANECLLKGLKIAPYLENASPLVHSQILNFNDIRQSVFDELSNPKATSGVESLTLPGLSQLLKGHRRGELSVWTGSTGSGKTTLLSQLSLDYCVQGVSTLWGSFEINNVRLAKTMLRQFSGKNLETSIEEFNYYADKFSELPLRFMKFHGSTSIDQVIDAMDYAVYVYDVRHIIIDNLQFMLSGQNSKPGELWDLQNSAIEKFRRFATHKNVHVSLVVHPRKEADGIPLGLSSVFGSVKSTQEADNVLILQNVVGENRCIDVKKNRFAGRLGRVTFLFDPVSLTAEEIKSSEFTTPFPPGKARQSQNNVKAFENPSVEIPQNIRPLMTLGNFMSNNQNIDQYDDIARKLSTMTNRAISSYRLNSTSNTHVSNESTDVEPKDWRNLESVEIDDDSGTQIRMPEKEYTEDFLVSTIENTPDVSQDLLNKHDEISSSSSATPTRKRSRKKAEVEQVYYDDEERIVMRGITVTKSSSMKEYREFIKVNRLSELIKTAGKGVSRNDIYDSIRSNVPSACIIKSTSKSEPSVATQGTIGDFGVSTMRPILNLRNKDVKIVRDLENFEKRQLYKVSLVSKNSVMEENPKHIDTINLPVYMASEADPLLSNGIIYVKNEHLLNQLWPLFKDVPLCAVDIESTGLDFRNDSIRLIQLSTPDQPSVILDLFSLGKDVLLRCKWLKDLFAAKNTVHVFHNGKFDINFLKAYGFEMSPNIFDTMIAAKLLSASRYNISCKLGSVAERYYNLVLDKSQQFSDWSLVPLFEEQILYASRDANVLLPLYVILKEKLHKEKLDQISNIEFKCILAVSEMESNGMKVDTEKLHKLQQELNAEHRNAVKKLGAALNVSGDSNFNFNSQKQLLNALQSMGVIDRSKRTLIQNTSEQTLSRNTNHPAISALREYRKINKAITAFTLKLPNHICKETGRIYPNFNQCGAESGRFSCDNPNLQQIPRDKKFRECFVASEGHKFVIADFSQIELRIAADIAKDQKMIEAYNKGTDLHSLTASLIKGKPISEVTKDERQLAKAVNFGLIFGMSLTGFRMYAETGYNVKLSINEAREIYFSFFNNFKGITDWHNRVKANRPTEVRTLSNRLSIFDSFSFTRSLNYPVQGTSADITKETMVQLVDKVKEINAKIVMCIHDEIIMEVPEEKADKGLEMLIETMQNAGKKFLKHVPCEAVGAIGNSWADKS
ncbi:DNA polymerase I family member protein [Theileria equi strain WA]|uniref:DNA polymerase I family member protein n=1 Tax=Theileria equi strain WA TaxID=1537102 RepID=L0AY70_THEEQ|nr:DNA polymerase I family member protein [Theileria equi strain WA]AFZ80208.1 DNA polymerase I family member protein [Theileria equi strain WA]|eukprot:XP_004829874.1 DNA polymerase I family member protein [Theileria equi strain WA]